MIHICIVCFEPAEDHDYGAEDEQWPMLPLCCFGCGCGSEEPDPRSIVRQIGTSRVWGK